MPILGIWHLQRGAKYPAKLFFFVVYTTSFQAPTPRFSNKGEEKEVEGKGRKGATRKEMQGGGNGREGKGKEGGEMKRNKKAAKETQTITHMLTQYGRYLQCHIALSNNQVGTHWPVVLPVSATICIAGRWVVFFVQCVTFIQYCRITSDVITNMSVTQGFRGWAHSYCTGAVSQVLKLSPFPVLRASPFPFPSLPTCPSLKFRLKKVSRPAKPGRHNR